MPESGRILRFRARTAAAVLDASEALSEAKLYLATAADRRDAELTRRCVEQPDVVLSLCGLLREAADVDPALVAEEASSLYEAVRTTTVGVFDEKQYFLGDTALIAGGAYRLLGKTQDAERWLDRAEAGFRHTVNPAPLMANVAYARLTLKFALGRYDEVIELLPSLIESFHTLRMNAERSKARFLEALALKANGQSTVSFKALTSLREDTSVREDSRLYGQVLVHIGDCLGQERKFAEALQTYSEALPFVRASNRLSALAELKWSIGSTCRAQDRLSEALDAFRDSRANFASLGMTKYVVFLHLESAECLLRLDRPREAEWELLVALPTIEEQKMVPEGFAAVALLKESVRRRKTDPNALRELREHIQANK